MRDRPGLQLEAGGRCGLVENEGKNVVAMARMMVAVAAMRIAFSGFRVNQTTIQMSSIVVIMIMHVLRDHGFALDVTVHVQHR